MIKMSEKIKFKISFYQNLYFHIEKFSGIIEQRYDDRYNKLFHNKTKNIEKIRYFLDPQVISWPIKEALAQCKNKDEMDKCIHKGLKNLGSEILSILSNNILYYKKEWDNTIHKKLVKQKETLDMNLRSELNTIVDKISNITGITWRKLPINIYIIDCISEEYGLGGEPLIDNICVGFTSNKNLIKAVVVHELIHLNLCEKLSSLIPNDFIGKEDIINEAITSVYSNKILGEKKPKFRDERKYFADIFWEGHNGKYDIYNIMKLIADKS